MNLINKLSLAEVLRPLDLEQAINAEDDDINRQAFILNATTNYSIDVGTIEPIVNFDDNPGVLDTVARDVASGLIILAVAGDAGEDALRDAMTDVVNSWETDTAHELLAARNAEGEEDGNNDDDD